MHVPKMLWLNVYGKDFMAITPYKPIRKRVTQNVNNTLRYETSIIRTVICVKSIHNGIGADY